MTSTTKITAFAFFLFISLHTQAQTDPCLEQLLQQPGTWKQNKNPESTAPADLAVEKRSTRTVHDMLRVRYSPMGGELQYGEGFGKNSPHPYDYWFYSIGILEYYCANGKIEKNHEGNTSLYVSFNQFSSAALYDTTTDVQLIGYHTLQHGIPEEVKPGIWHFPVDRAGLGFGQFGKSDMWLLTYDGKLPWSWVTRKQFLVKRRRNLLGLMESSRNSTQETIDRIEKEKTYKQEEYKNDPAKYEKYLRVDYNPGIERYKKFLQDNDKPYLAAIADIDKQLQQPESFLAEKAIIKQDTHDNLKYLFTEAMDPMAQVPILPNPDYFKRAPRHVAQFIELEIIWNHKDPIAVKFHDGIALALDMDVLKSYIGTVPPAATTVAPGSKPTMPALPSKISTPQADLDGPTGSIQQPEVDVKPSNPPPTTGKSATPAKAATTVTAGIPATSQPQVQTAQAAPSAKATSASAATLYAPTGSAVTIQSDAKEISATVQKGKEPLYGSAPVNLPPATSKDGSRNLSIKKLPAGMKGTILGMTGGAARICVDYNYDLLTRSSDDKTTGTFYESMDPAVGGYNGEEGRYVAFVTLAVGIDGSNGKYRQIFWRDRNTGVTKMISRAPDGGPGDADSYAPFMSANGQRVVFESNATNLVKDDKNGMKDIFVWDATDGKIRIVSAGSNGQAADGNSYEATISGDGNFIAFTSAASNLAATPKGTSNQNVFLHDLTKGKTEMISISATARQGGEDQELPYHSTDHGSLSTPRMMAWFPETRMAFGTFSCGNVAKPS